MLKYEFISLRKVKSLDNIISRLFQDCQKKICAVTGHYGSGKSFFSVNLAIMLKENFPKEYISMTDLDIVNPYFRSADSEKLLSDKSIDVIRQQYANSNVDIPSVPPELNKIFEREGKSVLDIGGDETGAVVVATIKEKIISYGYYHFFVVNFCRPMTDNAQKAFNYKKLIEDASGLEITHIINNTNLGNETDAEVLKSSVEKAKDFAALCGFENKLYHVCNDMVYNRDDEVIANNFIPMCDHTKKYF